MKRDGWEGGYRVPFIARWPAQLMNTTDIFATLASTTEYALPHDVDVNSFDL
ncbi:MAG: Bifunctional oligoribonuclease and phosphatase NrnA [Verrucomicrobiota bacterium]|jgi:arylsulfatase A-like enzyme